MIKQESGIDDFQLSWQLWKSVEPEYEVWQFVRKKREDETLKVFFTQNQEYIIIPKFIINETELAFWLNLNFYQSKYLDWVGGIFNSFYTWFEISPNAPSIRLLIHQFLGKKVDINKLREFGFKIKKVDNFWQELVKRENELVPLFICGCGDWMCGNFSIKISIKENLIIWNMGGYIKPFVFDFISYKKEFDELEELVSDDFLIYRAYSKHSLNSKCNENEIQIYPN